MHYPGREGEEEKNKITRISLSFLKNGFEE